MTTVKESEWTRGKLLYRLRTKRELTQAQLAKLTGVTPGTIHTIEKDERKRGMHPSNAIALLAALHDAKPMLDEEIAVFSHLFGMSKGDVLDAMRQSTTANTYGPFNRVQEHHEEAVIDLCNILGEEKAARCMGLLRDLVVAIVEPSPDALWANRNRPTVVSERPIDGGVVQDRAHYNADGQPLTPVPEGEGVIDDPDLIHLEAEIQAVTRAREEGKPLPSVSPAAQRVLDLISEAVKSDRNKNTA